MSVSVSVKKGNSSFYNGFENLKKHVCSSGIHVHVENVKARLSLFEKNLSKE